MAQYQHCKSRIAGRARQELQPIHLEVSIEEKAATWDHKAHEQYIRQRRARELKQLEYENHFLTILWEIANRARRARLGPNA